MSQTIRQPDRLTPSLFAAPDAFCCPSVAIAPAPGQWRASMQTKRLELKIAASSDFRYIYGLCEATMRGYVESDLGDCFEQIARPTIQQLLERGLFHKIYVEGALVGA